MRLARLTLDRFGHFTDHTFDFGRVEQGNDFHIVYGPNEAGKTTTMEAALRLFYGFPNREPYAFKHPRATLQISADLDVGGRMQSFTRLAKRNDALRDHKGTPLTETAIASHLAGLTETDYRHLLCLDDDTIERGGEEIANAKGDIGRLLFSAAAGVSDLSLVLEDMSAAAEDLWRKRKSSTRIALLKKELTEVERAIRQQDVTANAWRGLKKARQTAEQHETEARAECDDLRARLAQTEARRRALPHLAAIDQLANTLDDAPPYPNRLAFDPEQLVHMIAEARSLTAEEARLLQVIAEAHAAKDAVVRRPQHLTLRTALEDLEDLESRDAGARRDLGRRKDAMAEAEAAMASCARDLGLGPDVPPERLVLSQADLHRLDTTRDILHRAQDAADAAALELATAQDETRAATEALRQHVAEAPQSSVTAILNHYEADALAPEVAKAKTQLIQSEVRLAAALDRLQLGDVRFEALPSCPTSEARAKAWDTQHHTLSQQIARAEDACAEQRIALAALQAQTEVLSGRDGLVTDAEADALQTRRNNDWEEHKSTLSANSAARFEASLKAFDRAMKTRLAFASDLGRLRQLEQDVAATEARLKASEAQLADLRADRAAVEQEIAQVTATLFADQPPLPAEWLEWVRHHAEASRAASDHAALQSETAEILTLATALCEALAPHVSRAQQTLEALLPRARALAETEQTAKAARSKAQDALARAERTEADRHNKLKDAEIQRKLAKEAWTTLVQEVLNGTVSSDAVLANLETLRQLREDDRDRALEARRVATMQADQAQFLAAVTDLAEMHGLALTDHGASLYSNLRALLAGAETAEEQYKTACSTLTSAQQERVQVRDRLDQLDLERAAMADSLPSESATNTLEALRQSALHAEDIIAARQQKGQLEAQLLIELGLKELAAARDVLQETTPAELHAESEALKAELVQAEARKEAATEDRLRAVQDLANVSGTATVAALQERKATLELELEAAATRHLELSLGILQANEAIRRYRDTHRSAMMSATQDSFATLTQGRYPRLVAQPDKDKEILLAIDASGATKRAADMSKGTRFQLYLALRAAAHAQMVAQGTRLPFFCDDVFETFDENRTSAACRIMEEIGRNGQAIYLTHHRHVVEIAQKVCATPPKVHSLPATA